MRSSEFVFRGSDNTNIHTYCWMPDNAIDTVLQISHGMVETAARYERFARALTECGVAVYANDHRGHGKTAGSPDNVGRMGEAGAFGLLVEDMRILNELIREQNPDKRIFMLGHSMGSFALQRYVSLYGDDLAGAIFSGSSGHLGSKLVLAKLIVDFEVKRRGRDHVSRGLNKAVFGNFNSKFRPNRTEFDWLSRIPEEVDAYVSDPFCGNCVPNGFFQDFISLLLEIDSDSSIDGVPTDLPIYIFSGSMDPVGEYSKGPKALAHRYALHGCESVELKLYEGGRHEMLNELNMDEVTMDIIKWLRDKEK